MVKFMESLSNNHKKISIFINKENDLYKIIYFNYDNVNLFSDVHINIDNIDIYGNELKIIKLEDHNVEIFGQIESIKKK